MFNLKKENGFIFKKAFGQNFLTDRKICEKIVAKAEIDSEIVVEIGPGSGILTSELLKKAKKVVAIEKDKDLIPILKEKFKGQDRLILINEDFLKVNLKEIVCRNLKCSCFKICANLPYNITSPIIIKILTENLNIKSSTLMVQKEVANRIIATHKDKNYGSFSVFVRYYSEPEILFNVSRGSFFPIPKVDSAVVRLKKAAHPCEVENEEFFFKVVRASFSQRRKKVLNPLAEKFSILKSEIEKILERLSIEKNIRAEEISLEQYIAISNLMLEFLNSR